MENKSPECEGILNLHDEQQVLFKKNHEVKVSFKNFKLNGAIIKNIYAVGLPSIIMQSIGAVMMLGINTIFMTAGSAVSVTVFGIYFKLQSFVFMPCFGLNQGVMPVIGYNYGARNRKRVYSALKWGLIIAVIIMSVGVLLMWLIPDVLISMFGGGQELMKVGVPAFKTVSLCFLPAAAGILFTTLFQAVGKGVRSLLMSVCRQLVILLPVAFILAKTIGVSAVWYAFPIAEVGCLILAICFFLDLVRNDFKKLN